MSTAHRRFTRVPHIGAATRGEIEILEERLVHESPYVAVYDDRVRFPSGAEGTHFRWHWKAPYGVVALPVLEDGAVALVEVFRHGDRCWRLEAPRGFGAADQTPAAAALREVAEETGVVCPTVEAVKTVGGLVYPLHLFVARGGRLDRPQAAEANEALGRVHVFPPAALPDLIGESRVRDAETVLLLLWLLREAAAG